MLWLTFWNLHLNLQNKIQPTTNAYSVFLWGPQWGDTEKPYAEELHRFWVVDKNTGWESEGLGIKSWCSLWPDTIFLLTKKKKILFFNYRIYAYCHKSNKDV